MSEDERSPSSRAIDIHEEFIQHVEVGGRKIRGLAVTGFVVSVLLTLAYLSQLILPFATGTKYVQVDLTDPLLLGWEVFVLALALVWMYNSLREYLFTTRLSKQIKEIRRLEHELMRKYGLPEGMIEE